MIVSISKGQQITIPADIRTELGLEVGSKIEMIKIKDKIILTPIGKDLNELFIKTKKIKPKHGLTPEQMDELNERLFK